MDIATGKIPNIGIENIGTKNKPHYVIQGSIELAVWTGYFLYDEHYKLIKDKAVTNGRIKLLVDGKVASDGSFHISQAQVTSYLYLVQHQDSVKQAVLENLKKEFPRLLANEYASWDHNGPDFPGLSALTPAFDFKNYIGPEYITIESDVKNEIAYVTWNFRCRWDIEHGLEVITHQDSVIDIAPEVDIWKIYKDNGTYEQEQKKYSEKEWKLPKQKKWWQFW